MGRKWTSNIYKDAVDTKRLPERDGVEETLIRSYEVMNIVMEKRRHGRKHIIDPPKEKDNEKMQDIDFSIIGNEVYMCRVYNYVKLE